MQYVSLKTPSEIICLATFQKGNYLNSIYKEKLVKHEVVAVAGIRLLNEWRRGKKARE